MKITKLHRKHVNYFCEGCGKETFEGYVYGRYVNRQVRASSPDRAMYCEDCRPSPKAPPSSFVTLSSWYDQPLVGFSDET